MWRSTFATAGGGSNRHAAVLDALTSSEATTMRKKLSELRVFFREFRRHFKTTGAITPSSRFLGKALARFVPASTDGDPHRPRRILEVGPGTGAATRQIVRRLRPNDRFDLVELNESFVAVLERLFRTDPDFQPAKDRARIFHMPVQELVESVEGARGGYDLIISGLPLNNFSGEMVREILDAFAALARPGGTLSFFEYVAVRPARAVVSSRAGRARLREVGSAIHDLYQTHGFRRDCVLGNVPPAWVYHIRYE